MSIISIILVLIIAFFAGLEGILVSSNFTNQLFLVH